MDKKPLVYLGGDIMTHGSNLAREEEYEKFLAAELPVDVYSPVQNKDINDKSNMTEEENNCLAEKIVAADVERLWNSDITVMNPEQSAIGTMIEMGILYGWKYMARKLLDIWQETYREFIDENNRIIPMDHKLLADRLYNKLVEIYWKKNYAHYFDIRTNHLNEKDWRRSFSINQFLYGVILAATADGTLHNSFDEILPLLQEEYGKEDKNPIGGK